MKPLLLALFDKYNAKDCVIAKKAPLSLLRYLEIQFCSQLDALSEILTRRNKSQPYRKLHSINI